MDRHSRTLGRALEHRTVVALASVFGVIGLVLASIAGVLAVVGVGVGAVVGAAIGVALVVDARRHGLARLVDALGAAPVDESSQPRLHNLVDGLSLTIGLAPPDVYVVTSSSRNAVALSTEHGDAAIVVTSGLLSATGRIELEAAVAWLLSRIRSGDAASATTSAALTSRWPSPVQRLVRSLAPRGFPPAHLAGVDRDACAVTRYPPGLAGLLELVAVGPTAVDGAVPATAPTWLEWPFDSSSTPSTDDLDRSRTHPPLDERITLVRDL